jgi:hypothetical protein
MKKAVSRRVGLEKLGLTYDIARPAAEWQDVDGAEARLVREMRAVYALHDHYHHVVEQPVPQYLADLVATSASSRKQVP